jgi:hypothetical protein
MRNEAYGCGVVNSTIYTNGGINNTINSFVKDAKKTRFLDDPSISLSDKEALVNLMINASVMHGIHGIPQNTNP